MNDRRLTLRKAQETGRVADFIRQEEARGVKPVKGSDLDRALELVIKPRQSADRTSGSRGRGGSTEK